MRKTQKSRVVDYLDRYGSITSLEAFRDLGITRLSAVIYVLRHEQGLNIRSVPETSENRFGDTCKFDRYVLEQKPTDLFGKEMCDGER